jgi:RNA polymerase primary sigma factor
MDLSQYYESICKEPLLSTEEERDLFLEYQDEGVTDARKEQIRDRIIRANLRFAFKKAKAFSRNDPEAFGELICAGNAGLVVGFNKFNPNAGVKFLSYAGWWVDQEILLQMSQRVVKVPIAKQQLSAKIRKEIDRNPDITLTELKTMFPKARDKDIEEMYHRSYLTYYIEDLEGDPGFEIDPISEIVEARMDYAKISAAVAALPSPHREYIIGLFGFTEEGEKKQRVIAAELGLSKEQLKSVRKEAFEMLRQNLGDCTFLGDSQ